jgi:peptidoglycan-N-acetylglucosamine deacetylase
MTEAMPKPLASLPPHSAGGIVDRRAFLKSMGVLTASAVAAKWGIGSDVLPGSETADRPRISITMDDPTVQQSPMLEAAVRDRKIRDALAQHGVKAALFVCGKRVTSSAGKALLAGWDSDGHLLGNHSFSHLYFHSAEVPVERFAKDILDGEAVVKDYEHFRKIFRFPYLKEGNTQEKRDGMRDWLRKQGYSHGYVSIDASDWAIDDRLKARLKTDLTADLAPYRDFYLDHLWNRANYYNDLATSVLKRSVSHTLLIHHSLLNALFLSDVIEMFRARGWQWTSAEEAFADPMFSTEPAILPAGESIVWALARESGKYNDTLRYPGEDGDYEKPRMDELKL